MNDKPDREPSVKEMWGAVCDVEGIAKRILRNSIGYKLDISAVQGALNEAQVLLSKGEDLGKQLSIRAEASKDLDAARQLGLGSSRILWYENRLRSANSEAYRLYEVVCSALWSM